MNKKQISKGPAVLEAPEDVGADLMVQVTIMMNRQEKQSKGPQQREKLAGCTCECSLLKVRTQLATYCPVSLISLNE